MNRVSTTIRHLLCCTISNIICNLQRVTGLVTMWIESRISRSTWGKNIVLLTLIYHLQYLAITAIKFNRQGLTEIPPGISCLEKLMDFSYNSISRLEADDFLCFTELEVLSVSHNNITYIHEEAFFPMISMQRLTLTHNHFLGHLPAYFGPFASTMRILRMQNISLEYLAPNFFHQFLALKELRIAEWGLEKPDDDILRGLINTERIQATGLTVLPNLTTRVPALKKLVISGFVDGNIMESGVRHLTNMVEVFIRASCDNIRLLTFEGANMLTALDASPCAVREIPDLNHLTSLTLFDTDMSQFECNTMTCWMLFEDLSIPMLTWLTQATCKAPANLAGVVIQNLNPVWTACYRGKFGTSSK